jgi:hypothetical protein
MVRHRAGAHFSKDYSDRRCPDATDTSQIATAEPGGHHNAVTFEAGRKQTL